MSIGTEIVKKIIKVDMVAPLKPPKIQKLTNALASIDSHDGKPLLQKN